MTKQGLFYNTAPLGLGHLQRSFNLSKSLVQSFQVDYFLGSLPLLPIPQNDRFSLYQMPPLIKPYDGGPLQDPEGQKSESEIRESRFEFIKQNLNKPYDFFISEHIPFGRICLIDEILFLIKEIKAKNPDCLITSSFRGEKKIPEGLLGFTEMMIDKVYDVVFVHVDPNIAEPDLINLFPKFKHKFIFTGFITDPNFKPNTNQNKQIIVSMGGGTYGQEVIRLLVETAGKMKAYQFLFIYGPATTVEFKNELEKMKTKNIIFSPFQTNFVETLSESQLSISFGGAGTVSDLLLTKANALVYPHPSQKDQTPRVQKLEAKGILKQIKEEDLTVSRLEELIINNLNNRPPEIAIDLNGGKFTREKLIELLA